MKCYSLFLAVGLSTMACNNDLIIPTPEKGEVVNYDSHPKHSAYLQAISEYKDAFDAPGALLLVGKPGEELWVGAVGSSNLAYRTSMTTGSQFRTGSVTKMLMGTVILKLMEQGQLSLEDVLADHLPFVNGEIPEANKITLRHLLAHLSGIVDPPNESLVYQADLVNNPSAIYATPVEKLLKTYVYGKRLHFSPGTGYSYSNTNYWLLGLIAERLTGKALPQLMEEMIFEPLQMNHSYVEVKDDTQVARGYADLYNNAVLLDVSLWDRAEGDGRASGGLISTVEDLYRFMNGLFYGTLLKAETLEEMKKIQWAGCDSPYCEYGLGLEIWRTDAGTAYGHNGGLVGIEANVLYYEASGGITVLYKNNGNGSDKSWLDQIMK